MQSFTIPAALIDAAMLAVSTEETRYYLNGVFIDSRGYVVAIDGNIAFAAVCASALLSPDIIIPRGAVAIAAKGKGEHYTVTPLGAELWSLTRGAVTTHFTPINGTFPDWLRIIPTFEEPAGRVMKTKDETAAHFDPKYYTAMGKMAQLLHGGGKSDALRFEIIQDATGPCPVLFPESGNPRGGNRYRTDCMAVIMPIRRHAWGAYDRDVMLIAPTPAEDAQAA